MPYPRSRRKRLAVLAAFILGSIPAVSFGQESPRVTALFFENYPWIETVVSGGDDGSGVIRGTQIGGMVTSAFPEAVVLLKIGGPENFNEVAIREAIQKNFGFRCGNVVFKEHPALLIGTDVFSIRDGTFIKIGRGALSTRESPAPASNSVEFDLELLSTREETVLLAVRCTLPWLAALNPADPRIVLLNEIFGLRAAEPLLIGFPYVNSTRQKFVYWVALLLEK
jgi:hypothetical protein